MLKKNLEWLLLLILIMLIVSTLLSIIGYKVFCTLNQKIDWNAVSAISGFSMALFTVVAIFIAIYIPQKERITSSKIELFTQRFETYFFIVTIFSDAFEKGKSHFEDEELEKHNLRSGFLLDEQDHKKLGEICKSINIKREIKYKDETKPDLSISIDEELEAIEQVFDKYLNLRLYGVEHKN